ncbi:hypothetical protein D3C71_1783560 [compost metagenome]
MGEQLAHRHGVGEAAIGVVLQHLADVGVQTESARRDLLQDRHAGEHLAGGCQVEAVTGRQWRFLVLIAAAVRLLEQHFIALGDEHGARELFGRFQAQCIAVQLCQCQCIRLVGCHRGERQ